MGDGGCHSSNHESPVVVAVDVVALVDRAVVGLMVLETATAAAVLVVDCMYSSHANEAQANDKDFPVPVGDSKRRNLVVVVVAVGVFVGGRGRIPSNNV